MELLLLEGPANTGKTRTLAYLFHSLRASCGCRVVDLFNTKRGRKFSRFSIWNTKTRDDFIAFIRYMNANKSTLCIASEGDSQKNLQDNLQYFLSNQCDYAVMALRETIGQQSGRSVLNTAISNISNPQNLPINISFIKMSDPQLAINHHFIDSSFSDFKNMFRANKLYSHMIGHFHLP